MSIDNGSLDDPSTVNYRALLQATRESASSRAFSAYVGMMKQGSTLLCDYPNVVCSVHYIFYNTMQRYLFNWVYYRLA